MEKILLVEDNEIFNFISKKVIKKANVDADIKVALNGQKAFEMIEEEGLPDYILLDINMPKMDGFEFLDQYELMDKGHKTKVFMLTSSIRANDKLEAFKHRNVAGYYEKPLTSIMVDKMLGRNQTSAN